MDYKIFIPKKVQKILNVLGENGYESYIVGGCVRDSILNRKPNDFDITTNAKPEEVMNLFDKVIPTGLVHGTVTVIIENENFEITTYRTEGSYIDNRHPSEVNFVTDLREDLARRDFTINAMAYNENDGLKDYFNGLYDLENKIIKTVGDPVQRFEEDALRMLRAIRFSSQLNFEIESSTLSSIEKLNRNLANISKERIREELNKILISNPKKIEILKETNLLKFMLEFLDEYYYHKINIQDKEFYLFERSINAMSLVENKLNLRLAMLFTDFDKLNLQENYIEVIKKQLKNLKYDNDTINFVINIITHFNDKIDDDYDIKILLNALGEATVYDLIKLKSAYISSLNDSTIEDKIKSACESVNRIINLKECYSFKSLDINGRDLIESGFKKGKEIGTILNYLLDCVMKDNNLNEKNTLLRMAKAKFELKGIQ